MPKAFYNSVTGVQKSETEARVTHKSYTQKKSIYDVYLWFFVKLIIYDMYMFFSHKVCNPRHVYDFFFTACIPTCICYFSWNLQFTTCIWFLFIKNVYRYVSALFHEMYTDMYLLLFMKFAIYDMYMIFFCQQLIIYAVTFPKTGHIF